MSESCSPNKRTCKYFVTRKKRNCRMIPLQGLEFCAEHQQNSFFTNTGTVSGNLVRIPCPLDNKQ